MTWVGHKISSFSVVYLFTGDFLAGLITATGSTIPDLIEVNPYKYETLWKKKHRKLSHWPVMYLGIFSVLFYLYSRKAGFNIFCHYSATDFLNLDLWLLVNLAGIYMCLGAILHLAGDAITGKIPFWHPSKKTFGVKLFRTHSLTEYMFSIFLLVVTLILRRGG